MYTVLFYNEASFKDLVARCALGIEATDLDSLLSSEWLTPADNGFTGLHLCLVQEWIRSVQSLHFPWSPQSKPTASPEVERQRLKSLNDDINAVFNDPQGNAHLLHRIQSGIRIQSPFGLFQEVVLLLHPDALEAFEGDGRLFLERYHCIRGITELSQEDHTIAQQPPSTHSRPQPDTTHRTTDEIPSSSMDLAARLGFPSDDLEEDDSQPLSLQSSSPSSIPSPEIARPSSLLSSPSSASSRGAAIPGGRPNKLKDLLKSRITGDTTSPSPSSPSAASLSFTNKSTNSIPAPEHSLQPSNPLSSLQPSTDLNDDNKEQASLSSNTLSRLRQRVQSRDVPSPFEVGNPSPQSGSPQPNPSQPSGQEDINTKTTPPPNFHSDPLYDENSGEIPDLFLGLDEDDDEQTSARQPSLQPAQPFDERAHYSQQRVKLTEQSRWPELLQLLESCVDRYPEGDEREEIYTTIAHLYLDHFHNPSRAMGAIVSAVFEPGTSNPAQTLEPLHTIGMREENIANYLDTLNIALQHPPFQPFSNLLRRNLSDAYSMSGNAGHAFYTRSSLIREFPSELRQGDLLSLDSWSQAEGLTDDFDAFLVDLPLQELPEELRIRFSLDAANISTKHGNTQQAIYFLNECIQLISERDLQTPQQRSDFADVVELLANLYQQTNQPDALKELLTNAIPLLPLNKRSSWEALLSSLNQEAPKPPLSPSAPIPRSPAAPSPFSSPISRKASPPPPRGFSAPRPSIGQPAPPPTLSSQPSPPSRTLGHPSPAAPAPRNPPQSGVPVEQIIEKANLLTNQGQFPQAITILRDAYKKSSSEDRMQILLCLASIAEFNLNQPETALNYYKEINKMGPSVQAHKGVARIEYAKQNWQDVLHSIDFLVDHKDDIPFEERLSYLNMGLEAAASLDDDQAYQRFVMEMNNF